MKAKTARTQCGCTRRTLVVGGMFCGAVLALPKAASGNEHAEFVRAAAAMKDQAVKAGDQAYGAVIVRSGSIVGFGPSRVVAKRDSSAHAEREAIRDAQMRLGTNDLSECVMYSTSRPCGDCELAAARSRLARMYFGPQPADAGRPRGG